MYQSSEKGLSEDDFDASKPLHPRYFGVGNTKIYIEKMLSFSVIFRNENNSNKAFKYLWPT